MTPVSTERHEALREIGFELRDKAGTSLARQRRRRLSAAAGAAVCAIALTVGISLPHGGTTTSEVAMADVLHKAAESARRDLVVGPDQSLYRGAKLYRHYWSARGDYYDYWTVADEQHWIADDGSALLRVSKAAGPSFISMAERQRYINDGSPPQITLSPAIDRHLAPGSLLGVKENVGASLSDYAGDPELVTRVLQAYRVSAARLVELADDQDAFNEFVRSHVRAVIATLRNVPESEVSDAEVEHSVTALIIGLFVNWGAEMPAELRPAFLDLLADSGGSGFEFNPEFTDETGRNWIAYSAPDDPLPGDDPSIETPRDQADVTLLFDPQTFELRGSRITGPDGRTDFTEIVAYGAANHEGEVPDGLPSL